MSSFTLSEQERHDLEDIFIFGYDRFGERKVDRYADELEHLFRFLADNPRMGRRASMIAPDTRRHEHRAHVILCEEAPTGVTILAVVQAGSITRLRL